MKKKTPKHKVTYLNEFIYPLTRLNKKKYQIKDHINLSGINPLKGPKFISLSYIYKTSKSLNKKYPQIIVVGLQDGVEPTNQEKQKLLKVGVKAYCYKLVPKVILRASKGLKVKAIGIVSS